MLYDVIVTNKETKQEDLVKYFIRIDRNKIVNLYSKLISNPNKNIELLANMDSLLNNDFRPIFYILNKDELDENDIILKDCVIINVEKVTPLYAIPGARKIMEDYNRSLDKSVIDTDEKELVFNPILNDDTIIENNLIKEKDPILTRKLVSSIQE